PAVASAGAPWMLSTDFSSGVSRTRLSAIMPVRKKMIPPTRTAAMPLLTSILSMRPGFPIDRRRNVQQDPPARRCARPSASIRCAHHRETTQPHQPTPSPHPAIQTGRTPHVNPIVVIPSRMASTRLPGKPLADIHGKPMIVHVLDRAVEADIGPVAVACGGPEIAEG